MTTQEMVIRDETMADAAVITEVTVAAFETMEISSHTEQFVIEARLKDLNAKGCCLVGHPQYYRKFGFENVSGLVHQGVPQEVFFALAFDGRFPQGDVMFHEGFKANGHQALLVTPIRGVPDAGR